MFLRKKVLVLLPIALTVGKLYAQDTTVIEKKDTTVTTAPIKKSSIKSFKEFAGNKAITKEGLFTVHKIEDKFYFEIPDSLFGREILVTTRLVKVPTGSPKYAGEIVNTKTIAFYKGPSNNLFLKVITHVNLVDSNNAIAKAVHNASENPIVASFDVKALGKNNKNAIIDVTDYFKNDNAIVGFSADSKQKMQLGALAADRSYFESVNTYPINIEIKSLKTFSAGAAPRTAAVEGEAPPATDGAAAEGGALTLGTSTSLMLLPKEPMQQRIYDPRVGYFAEEYNVFSDQQQKLDVRTFIVRFRMEPKDNEIEKYKRGELVEPKKQIVFYTDPAMPKQWRPYVIAGINAWQKAFEQAGFKNAIVGKEWPENDTTMDIDDARYLVVRYFPSMEKNAQGVQVHDPRSGEILQAYVGWHMSIMRLLHDWYMLQAGAIDPKARTMKFDNDLMGKLIEGAVTHEIGHTLGLRHNMGSSATVPVENLRNKAWVEANGIAPSIMDYARFNFVAQPEDNISEAGILPRIGAYDKWAIQWGYKYLGVRDINEEKKITTKWITDSLKTNSKLWFGGEGRNNDPRSQTEDLSDNNIKANEYGLKNLKIVAANLEQWTKEPNDTYDNLEDLYDKLGGQYKTFIDHVINNIGGVYETIKTTDEGGSVYTIVPKSVQKASVDFINKEVFETPEWGLNKNMLNKFRRPGKEEWMQKVQGMAVTGLLSATRLHQLDVNEKRFGTENAYSLDEYLSDIEKGLFSELTTHKNLDVYKRGLQKTYISFINRILSLQAKVADAKVDVPDYGATDMPAVLRAHLAVLKTSLKNAMPLTKSNADKTHFQYLSEEIETMLNKN
jgi:hypothetical protein